ncbi:hypothetical protein HYH03_002782 [Edaphochlamys debaryana]|uniref:Uncharacterized protein n=1 Tax=Edaphochlamys debaryana TaxID=47281 RepID=A0A835YAS9_9CHLO|nr:hypothetical protein HYH03_002782 [Edaphochlamys debaryana]|eukprot:KAG2499201.1 hypothetical protein HYH03_002782 [Edaphochlamys debaryana]
MSGTVTVPLHVEPPVTALQLRLGRNCKLASNNTQGSIYRGLASELAVSLPVAQRAILRVKRTSDDPQAAALNELGDLTLGELLDNHGAVVVDLCPVLRASGDLFCRLDALEQSHKQLQRKVEEQGLQLEILKQSATEYAKVLRRSLLEDASKYIEQKAGPRQQEEAWNSYSQRQEGERGSGWLLDLNFPAACTGLLRRGLDTPFHYGCTAAHQLRAYNSSVFLETDLAGVPEDSQDPWVELFKFPDLPPPPHVLDDYFASLGPEAGQRIVWSDRLQLNAQQRLAVREAARGAHHPLPYIVFALLGTGKTSTLVEVAVQPDDSPLAFDSKNCLGFLKNPKRFNVASREPRRF